MASKLYALIVSKQTQVELGLVSASTYQKALQIYPTHISYQGRIQSEAVQRSSIRDLNMFQAYIWLCLLEDNIAVIEKRLLPVCLQVFPLINVKWELVNFAIQTIMNIIQQQLSSSERALFDIYSVAIEELFLTAEPNSNQSYLWKEKLQYSKLPCSIDYIWQSD